MNITDTMLTSAVSHMAQIPNDALGTWFRILVWGQLAAGTVLAGAVFWGLWKQWRKQHGRQ